MELFTPDLGLVAWMFVAFLILLFVLWKWGWPTIIKSMDKRADTIDKGVEYARQAKEQLDNAKAEAQNYLNEARKQQNEIIGEANKMKTQIIEEAREEARAAAKKEMDDAKVAIEQQRKEAEHQFRNEVSKFSIDIAEKMMRSQLKNDDQQKALVDKLLDEIQSN